MPKISLSGPAELLTIIPFHLGFQPVRSVVVVCFHGKRLGLVARLDIVGAELAAEAAAQTAPTLLRSEPSSVALVAFEEVADESLPLLEALTDAVERSRVVVRERLLVRDGRWRSVGCDCCPDEGWLLPERADVPAVADYVALGHAVLPDRDDLGRLVEPLAPTQPGHDVALAGLDQWQRRYAASAATVRTGPSGPRRRGTRSTRRGPEPGLTVLRGGDADESRLLVTEALSAWSGVLHGDIGEEALAGCVPSLVGPLRDPQFRDALIGWLCPGAVPLDGFPAELVALVQRMLGPELRVSVAVEGSQPPAPSGRGRELGEWSEASAKREGDEWEEVLEKLEALDALEALGGFDDVSEVDDLDDFDDFEEEADDFDAADFQEADAVEEFDPSEDGEAVHREEGDELRELDGWDEALAPRRLLARLEQVCRLTPAPHAAPLLSVVASVAWWCGDGARSGIAVDRALELEPEHRLCRLVRQSLDLGIRPPRCA